MWGVFLCASILTFASLASKETGNMHVRLSKEDSEGSILLSHLIKKTLQ